MVRGGQSLMPRRAKTLGEAQQSVTRLRAEGDWLRRQAALGAVTEYVHAVQEQVEARLAAGETAAVAYPEALRHELERIRRATE
jgi:hypothetical protein